jgi:hypothetical protein
MQCNLGQTKNDVIFLDNHFYVQGNIRIYLNKVFGDENWFISE